MTKAHRELYRATVARERTKLQKQIDELVAQLQNNEASTNAGTGRLRNEMKREHASRAEENEALRRELRELRDQLRSLRALSTSYGGNRGSSSSSGTRNYTDTPDSGEHGASVPGIDAAPSRMGRQRPRQPASEQSASDTDFHVELVYPAHAHHASDEGSRGFRRVSSTLDVLEASERDLDGYRASPRPEELPVIVGGQTVASSPAAVGSRTKPIYMKAQAEEGSGRAKG
eukprot:CAMPEP_0198425390 /NCGR_PEP_ID=MMETSP1452-20131203/4537_1 /TAXON_ID=1181717 /ORGANISM="Synchroma pusillum, Strain CCMP3072" /LENGTH=229 /DNA_ID=CAMNT_0044145745 /DNA_START=9 /DNA_END=695 /DNA_ORIENTATION=-